MRTLQDACEGGLLELFGAGPCSLTGLLSMRVGAREDVRYDGSNDVRQLLGARLHGLAGGQAARCLDRCEVFLLVPG